MLAVAGLKSEQSSLQSDFYYLTIPIRRFGCHCFISNYNVAEFHDFYSFPGDGPFEDGSCKD